VSRPDLPAVPIRHQREATITRLCEHFARDHVDALELERLIDRAHAAVAPAELDALLEGLPELATPSVQPAVAIGEVEASGRVIALMGGVERKGGWTPPRRLDVVAFMGGVVLDFRDARLADGVTEVRVVAFMGGVEIIVPPDLAVSSDGIGIMGGFGHSAESGVAPVAGPRLRVTGAALMGGVDISARLPGESPRDARRRRRREAGERGSDRVRRIRDRG
jgi:hypothetical protein